MTARASVSIDLDGLACYYRIHGLGDCPSGFDDTVILRAVPRFAELFARRGIHATFFVVGQDAATHEPTRALLGDIARAGHELGNHSYSHHYDLARKNDAIVDDEIGRCDDVLRSITGKATAGFRAPGYDVSPAMLDAMAARSYVYDSSIFPAPAYYAAKAAVMAGLAAMRRPSGAVMTNPRALVAPADPYRPSMTAPWKRGQASMVELPIAVTPLLRVPAIGTSLLLAPQWLRTQLVAQMAKRPFFNFELHGIDLIDAELDGIPEAVIARQPDLRVPLAKKLERLDHVLAMLEGVFEIATLADVATIAQREL